MRDETPRMNTARAETRTWTWFHTAERYEKEGNKLETELRAAQTQIDSLTKERDALRLCAADTSDLSNKQVHIESLQQQNEAMRRVLEDCHPAKIWDHARQAYTSSTREVPQMIRDWHDERCKQVNAALSSPTTERFVRREVLERLVASVTDYTTEREYQNVAHCKRDQDEWERALLVVNAAAKAEPSRTEGAKE